MIKTGLEVLVTQEGERLRGRRIGLVTQSAAILPDVRSSVDALLDAGATLTALFGPEHGIDGAAPDAAHIEHAVHARLGIPIFSLYGVQHEPTPAMLAQVDLLVFDMQDVGVRFYTYLSTLFYVLRSAGAAGIPVLVLDRPNPITGVHVEGPLLEPDFQSFVGMLPLPIRHGMTLGELARMINDEARFGVDLTVLPMQGWGRNMWFDETGLPWAATSPGMPHLSTVTVYPGACLIEGTTLSEGRGTTLPFEIVGAPWLDGDRLARTLNGMNLPGVRFRPVRFTPTDSKHTHLSCAGVQWHVLDRALLRPVVTGLHVVAAIRSQHPEHFEFLTTSWEGRPPHFDLLMGNVRVRAGLEQGVSVEELTADWPTVAEEFRRRRRPYLIYGAKT
jgi:uncharacterized protein YbbC (DUF1343 family)